MIPGKSEAVLDCRLLPDQDPNEFVSKLKEIIADPRVKIDYIERPVEAVISPYDTGLFKVIEKETRKAFPDSLTVPHLVIYGTDSRFYRGKRTVCYGFFPGPVTMEEYQRHHRGYLFCPGVLVHEVAEEEGGEYEADDISS